jgi:hypothetical protein
MVVGEVTVAARTGRHANEKSRADITYGRVSEEGVLAYHTRRLRTMPNLSRVVAFVLLLIGITLVFVGLTRAVGFTPLGIVVSLVAIAGLLFTGGVWFGAPAPQTHVTSALGSGSPILFDIHGRVVSGPNAGQPVASRFPDAVRAEVERHCAIVLAGSPARFPCLCDGKPVVFEALPVRSADGAIVYGLFVPAGARTGVVAEAS